MSLVLNYTLDHDLDIPMVNGRINAAEAERKIRTRLGDLLNSGDSNDRPWSLLSVDEESNSCELSGPYGVLVAVYPKAMELYCIPTELAIGPFSWFRFLENYFELRDPETRKYAHDTILKIKELFAPFHPTTFLAQGDNMGFECLYDEIEDGATLNDALRHGGPYERQMIDEWNCWPKGFRLMGEADTDIVDGNYDHCVLFYQKLDELPRKYVHVEGSPLPAEADSGLEDVTEDYVSEETWSTSQEQQVHVSESTTEIQAIPTAKEPRTIGDNEFTDERDGEVYRTVKIGDQVWMAENLRYAPPPHMEEWRPRSLLVSDYVDKERKRLAELKDSIREMEGVINSNSKQVFGASKDFDLMLGFEIKDKKSAIRKLEKFLDAIGDGKNLGRLYTWISANDLDWKNLGDQDQVPKDIYDTMCAGIWRGIAPSGWRIPNREDFKKLCEYCERHSQDKSAVSLKSRTGWEVPHKSLGCGGTDEFGFNAVPSGFCDIDSKFGVEYPKIDCGLSARYWTCTPQGTPSEPYLAAGAMHWSIVHRLPNLYPMRDYYTEEHLHEDSVCKETYMAIRCIKMDE